MSETSYNSPFLAALPITGHNKPHLNSLLIYDHIKQPIVMKTNKIIVLSPPNISITLLNIYDQNADVRNCVLGRLQLLKGVTQGEYTDYIHRYVVRTKTSVDQYGCDVCIFVGEEVVEEIWINDKEMLIIKNAEQGSFNWTQLVNKMRMIRRTNLVVGYSAKFVLGNGVSAIIRCDLNGNCNGKVTNKDLSITSVTLKSSPS